MLSPFQAVECFLANVTVREGEEVSSAEALRDLITNRVCSTY